MQVTAEKIDNHTTLLNVEVPSDDLAQAIERAYKKIASSANIAGFRKGKAPRKVIEARIGKKALLEEAFDIIAPKFYAEALQKENLEPVSPPNIDVVTLEEGQPLVFKATVIAKPNVVLGQYKGLSAEKPSAEVTDEELESEILRVRERNARMVVPEDGAEIIEGDMAIIDYEGFIDEVAFEGGKGASYPLKIGSGNFIPGFEAQLVGAKAGEEREISVTFPQEYHAPDMAGKDAKFKVKIHDIKRRELPELDDEFAKDLGDGEFETLDQYKEHLKNELAEAKKFRSQNMHLTNLVHLAADNAQFEVPDIMVENQLDGFIESMDFNLKMRGLRLEDYLAYNNRTLQQFRDEQRDAALREVRNELTLSQIGKEENIEVTPEDLKAEAEEMAQEYGTSAEEILKASLHTGRMDALVSTVLRKKAAQFLVDNAAE